MKRESTKNSSTKTITHASNFAELSSTGVWLQVFEPTPSPLMNVAIMNVMDHEILIPCTVLNSINHDFTSAPVQRTR